MTTSQRLGGLLAQPDMLSMPGISAVVVKGSFATGLAGRDSDLDLWVVTEQQRNVPAGAESSVLDLPEQLRSYLEKWIPQAIKLDPPVELDITTHVAFRDQYARALRLLRSAPSPAWPEIEAVHEMATSRWIVGSAASFSATRLPVANALAQAISTWCHEAARLTLQQAEMLFDGHDCPAEGTERTLAEAVAQLCSAVLAAHGYDNPKAKWRLPQARLLGNDLGKMIESALQCSAAAKDPRELSEWFRASQKCFPSGN